MNWRPSSGLASRRFEVWLLRARCAMQVKYTVQALGCNIHTRDPSFNLCFTHLSYCRWGPSPSKNTTGAAYSRGTPADNATASHQVGLIDSLPGIRRRVLDKLTNSPVLLPLPWSVPPPEGWAWQRCCFYFPVAHSMFHSRLPTVVPHLPSRRVEPVFLNARLPKKQPLLYVTPRREKTTVKKQPWRSLYMLPSRC